MSDIETVRKQLDHAFASNGQQFPEQVQETLIRLGEAEQLTRFIGSILDSSDALNKSASLSYQHANGFDKIVLISPKGSRYKLRLHIWWPEEGEAVIENVHNHRWDFAAVMLSGSYKAQHMELADSGVTMHHYLYSSPEGKDRYSMEYLGTVALRRTYESLVAAGAHYFVSHALYHRVVAERKELTATLMLQGAPIPGVPVHVFAPRPISNHEEVDASPLGPEALRGKLETFLDDWSKN